MRTYIAGLVLLGSVRALANGLLPLGEHVDLQWHYDSNASRWTCRGVTSGTGGSDVFWNLNQVFLPLSDKPYRSGTPSNSGSRNTQPVSPSFAFTGVAIGSPLWMAVFSNPGADEAWPGMDNAQESGTFGEYFEADTRLPQPQTMARPWIKVHLKEVNYHGPAASAPFSMSTVSGSTPRVWMASADGITQSDYFLYAAGTHTHMNWGFGAMGVYQIKLAASAYLGPQQTQPTGEGEAITVTFAVGPVANWQARNFSSDEVMRPEFSGLAADPDGDGMENLAEYAFGLSPRSGVRAVVPGLGLPVFSAERVGPEIRQVMEYPRRRTLEHLMPLQYSVEFSDALEQAGWSAPQAGMTESVADFQGEQAALNAIWQKVRVERMVPGSQRTGFARVRLLQE